jgi:hypothetical protein
LIASDQDVDDHVIFVNDFDEFVKREGGALERPGFGGLNITGLSQHETNVFKIAGFEKNVDVLSESRLGIKSDGHAANECVPNILFLEVSDHLGKLVEDIHPLANSLLKLTRAQPPGRTREDRIV